MRDQRTSKARRQVEARVLLLTHLEDERALEDLPGHAKGEKEENGQGCSKDETSCERTKQAPQSDFCSREPSQREAQINESDGNEASAQEEDQYDHQTSHQAS